MLPRPSRIIVPQYTRPKDLSLVASAELLGDGKRAIAAQVIDFAVRKVVTISREKGKGRKTGFTLTLAVGSSSRTPMLIAYWTISRRQRRKSRAPTGVFALASIMATTCRRSSVAIERSPCSARSRPRMRRYWCCVAGARL